MTSPSIEYIPLLCSVMDQSITTFAVFQVNKKVTFQSKGFENNTMYLRRFRRINKVEKFVEGIGTLKNLSTGQWDISYYHIRGKITEC